MATVLLIGSNGQLAQDIARCWEGERPGDRLIGLSHAELEVADVDAVRGVVQGGDPELVINTSAHHKVDAVEEDVDRAFQVNGTGARNLAIACRDSDAALVHISTDYVFSGRSSRPYVEDDPLEPLNVYGVSKAAGEMLVRAVWPKHYIIRTCGLYGIAGSSGKGGNFVETMLRLAEAEQRIRVVNDQVLTPTHTAALARQIVRLVTSGAFGTYHATCQGECSWYEFAREIFRQAGREPYIEPQTTAESGARARRPAYSVLENWRLRDLGLDVMPGWREALSDYLAARTAKNQDPLRA
jgi:dTDP-4-dehydrorhamnose reductase